MLKTQVDRCTAEFDKKGKARKRKKQQHEDEEDWTLVPKKGRNPGWSSEESVEIKKAEKKEENLKNHHSRVYCQVVSSCIVKLQNPSEVLQLLKPSSDFLKYATANEDFLLYFLKTLFVPLVATAERFKDDSAVFQAISQVLEKCVVTKTEWADSEEVQIGKELQVLQAIMSLYQKQRNLAPCAYRLLFQSVCNSQKRNFKEVYRFFVFLVDHLGFDLSASFHIKNAERLHSNNDVPFSFSVDVLTGIFSILSNHQCLLDCSLNNVNFSDFLRGIVLSAIKATPVSNPQIFSLLQYTIAINPLIVEEIITELIIYLMVDQRFSLNIKQDYEKLMVSILQVFSKLHRIERFFSIAIRSLKCGLEGTHKSEKTHYNFQGTQDLVAKETFKLPNVDDLLSNTVLQAFSQHVITLASWQIINIFKSFNFHFSAALELIAADEKQDYYVETLSALFCCFLRSARVAEHTVTSIVQEKFHKEMEELKMTLSKFGGALLNREHNHVLMRAYLNVCYTWGEACIMVAYYSPDLNRIVAKIEDSDYTLCNLIYLHNYLSRDQWCMIAQRITNFGETPCKNIMCKLYVQKLKAMYAFRASNYAEVKRAVVNEIAPESEETWKVLLQEQLFLNQILPELDHQSVLLAADSVMKSRVLDDEHLRKNQTLIDCNKLMIGVLYNCLHKMKKLLKGKKSGENRNFFNKQVFAEVDVNKFIDGEENAGVHNKFKEVLLQDADEAAKTQCAVEMGKMDFYFSVLKELPVLHMSKNVQDVLVLYLIALMCDFKCLSGNDEVKRDLEIIVTDLLHHNPDLLLKGVPLDILFAKIITLFLNWDEILAVVLQCAVKSVETLQKLQNGIDFIFTFTGEKFLQWAVIFSNIMSEAKKLNLCQESKSLLANYRVQIHEKIVSLLASVELKKSLEAYSVSLKFYLSQDKLGSLSQVEEMLESYLDCAISSLAGDNVTSGAVALLVTVLRSKAQLKLEESLPLKIWQAVKHLTTKRANISNKDDFLQLNMSIFEHVTDEGFTVITEELVHTTTNALSNGDIDKYLSYLEIWNAVLCCYFKSTKTSIWQNALDALLKGQLEYFLGSQNISLSMVQETGMFQQRVVQTKQVPLKASMTDTFLCIPSALLIKTTKEFAATFLVSASLMESLLKHRNAFIMDRLPTYLQQYRYLMRQLCVHARSDLDLDADELNALSNCAHVMEKLTNSLVQNGKPMIRVAPYLIADLLSLFEEFTLYANVKVHFNNCLYSLMSLGDKHSVAYLMRVLSTASTEMFKITFEHYRKHHRFTGKV